MEDEPLKIKIFMWFLSNKLLLTKDNLDKRKRNRSQKCYSSDSTESIETPIFTLSRCTNYLANCLFDI
jgi:hypothetical protein